MKYFRARPLIAAALAVTIVFAVASSAWWLVQRISLPEQKPLLESILWFMTWLSALAFGTGAWALANAELRASEERAKLERVLNASLHGFKVLEAVRDGAGQISDFRLLFVNKEAGEIMGIDFEPLKGRRMLPAGASFEQDVFERYRNVIETGEPLAFERLYRREDGSRWLYTRVAKFEDGVVATFADISKRKEIEVQAQKNIALLQMTGRMTRSGGWEVVYPGRIVKWSPEVYDIHEVDPDFVPDVNSAINFYAEGSRKLLAAAVEACEREGKPFDLEVEFFTARNRKLWIHTMGRAEHDEEGNLIRIYGTFQDITESKTAGLEVVESREQLQLALSGAAMGLWDWNLPSGRLQVDKGAAGILGYDLAELEPTDEQWNSLIHPDDIPAMNAATARHLNGEDAIFEAEYRMRAKNGEWVWVLDRGKGMDLDENGKPTRLVGTVLDITPKKTLEAERLSHLEVLEKITSQAPGAVYQYRVTADGVHSFLYVSGHIADVYDRTPDELLADVERGYDLIHPDDAARVRDSATDADGPPSEWRLEFRIFRKDGMRWILDQSTPEILPDGGILWHGFLMDITDQKRIDQQLVLAKEQAEEAGRAKAEFLAMMSHEIRTPMNAILGFADLLAQKSLLPEEQEYVRTIAGSGESLLRIIDDILDYSRIESGRLQLEKTVFSPEKLLDDLSILLTPSAEKKGLGLEVVTLGDIPPFVEGDAGRLRQILLNLAGNAVKFTPSGTVALGVKTTPYDEGRGLIRLQFYVRDAGPGIPPGQSAHIFEPFAQADSSVSRKHGGTGLGLAISRSLAGLMGGFLWFESEPDQGATFYLEVPLGLPDGLPRPEAQPAIFDAEFARKNPLRILAVDDDAVNLRLIEHILHKLGYSPRVAHHGEAALALCEAEWPECILLDVQMPGLDGLEVTRRLREIENREKRRPIHIVALTANVLNTERQACFASGMSAYLTKPLRREHLARVLAEASRTNA